MSESRTGYLIIGAVLVVAICVIAWWWHRADLLRAASIAEHTARMQLGMGREAPPTVVVPGPLALPPPAPPRVETPPPLPTQGPTTRRDPTWKCGVYPAPCYPDNVRTTP